MLKKTRTTTMSATYEFTYKTLSAVPAILWQFIFMLIPIITMVAMSFWRSDPTTLTLTKTFTLENYTKFFTSSSYIMLMIRTLKISAISVVAIISISYPLAYHIALGVQKKSRQLLFLVALFLPFWTSYLVRTFAWLTILGRSGLVNTFLMSLNLISEPISALLFNENTTMLGIVYVWLPFGILPIYAAIDGIDRSTIEASKDLGANDLQTFIHITFPQSMPGILASAIILFIPITGSFVEPSLLGGLSGVMIGVTLLRQYGAGFMWPFGNAMAFILLATTGGIMLIVSKFVKLEKILRF